MSLFDWAVAAVAAGVLVVPAIWERAGSLLSMVKAAEQPGDWKKHWINQLMVLQQACEQKSEKEAVALTKDLIWTLIGGTKK